LAMSSWSLPTWMSDVALTKIFKVFSDPDLPFGGKADPGALIRLRLASGSPLRFA
jgi:hypothetical protein